MEQEQEVFALQYHECTNINDKWSKNMFSYWALVQISWAGLGTPPLNAYLFYVSTENTFLKNNNFIKHKLQN
jgi:hypothetical protein